MICGEWVDTIIWMPLTLQMSMKQSPSFCCQLTWSEISGSSMMTTEFCGAWKSMA